MALVSALNAQGFKLGITLKPNLSWYSKPDVPKVDSINLIISDVSALNYSAGLSFDLFFAENYAIGSGLAFATKGSGIKNTIKGGVDSGKVYSTVYSSQYVDIPLTLKLFFGENVKTFVQLGGAFDILISAKGGKDGTEKSFLWDSSKNVVVTKPSTKTEEIDYSKFVSFLDIPLRLGLGMSFPMGAGGSRFFFSLQYERGLTNSYSDNGGETGGVKDMSFKNNMFGLELGVSF